MVQISPKLYALPGSEHPCAFSAAISHSSTWSLLHPIPHNYPSLLSGCSYKMDLRQLSPIPPHLHSAH